MIKETITYDYDRVLLALLESNDHSFSGGRAELSIRTDKKNIFLDVVAKDESAHRAMMVSINNTKKILDKAKNSI